VAVAALATSLVPTLASADTTVGASVTVLVGGQPVAASPEQRQIVANDPKALSRSIATLAGNTALVQGGFAAAAADLAAGTLGSTATAPRWRPGR